MTINFTKVICGSPSQKSNIIPLCKIVQCDHFTVFEALQRKTSIKAGLIHVVMSPAHNSSSVLQCFEHSNADEIHNRINVQFLPGALPSCHCQICIFVSRDQCTVCTTIVLTPQLQDTSITSRFLIGLMAGSMASVSNLPIDVAKSRIQGPQPQNHPNKYRKTLATIRIVFKEEGYVCSLQDHAQVCVLILYTHTHLTHTHTQLHSPDRAA